MEHLGRLLLRVHCLCCIVVPVFDGAVDNGAAYCICEAPIVFAALLLELRHVRGLFEYFA